MKFYVKTKISPNKSKTPEGFLLCRNVMLTHTGALRYGPGEHPFGADVGVVVMKREPTELFSPATMGSFEGKDITIQHPEDFVSPDNYQDLSHGVLLNVREGKELIEVEGEMVKPMMGDLLIKSSEAIEAVEEGLEEVSLGYEAQWELIKDGEGRHSKIVGNHCALVDEGRAGIYCAIKDSKKGEIMFTKEQFEKFKGIFKGKSLDEVMKEKEDDDKKTAKDAEEAAAKEKADKEKTSDEKVEQLSKDVAELKKSIGDLLEAIAGKGKKKEDESEDDGDSESEEIVADEDEEEEDDNENEGEDGSEEDDDEKEKKEDKKAKAGDTASLAEILSPGIKVDKDVKKNALASAYKTADGKKVIDSLTNNKGPAKLTKEGEVAVFVAAANMLRGKRVKDLASTRITTIDSFPMLKGSETMTADKINEMNKKHYGLK